MLSPSQSPAGTKRLSNLLRASRWSAHGIAAYLRQRQHTRQQVRQWHRTGEEVLALWDESVQDKPQSQAAQGLPPVCSSKAARLSCIKPGYYRPPGAPAFVPVLEWMALLFIRRSDPPCVAAMQPEVVSSHRKAEPRNPAPLYRLRLALSRLFHQHPPNFTFSQSSR